MFACSFICALFPCTPSRQAACFFVDGGCLCRTAAKAASQARRASASADGAAAMAPSDGGFALLRPLPAKAVTRLCRFYGN
jgi:hypothetical protein